MLLDVFFVAHIVLCIYMPTFKILDSFFFFLILGYAACKILSCKYLYFWHFLKKKKKELVTLSLHAYIAMIGYRNTHLRQVYILHYSPHRSLLDPNTETEWRWLFDLLALVCLTHLPSVLDPASDIHQPTLCMMSRFSFQK